MWIWESKFNKPKHCPEFRKDRSKNPVTNRSIKNGGPVQKWYTNVCSGKKTPTTPPPRRTLRPRINNLGDFVKSQGPVGIEKLINSIMVFGGGRFIPDLKIAFTRAYRGAVDNQIQEVIIDLGTRKIRISSTGPIATRLRKLGAAGVRESQISGSEVSQRNFCQTKNIKAIPSRRPFQGQPHQYKALGFMANPNSRLLLYHGLGSGKSCSSAMVADAYIKSNPDNLVYFISPGGLRSNFIAEYCTFCPVDRRIDPDNENYKNFRFFSSDDGTLKKKLPRRFENCLVIVDEAQSLIDCVKSGLFPPTSQDMEDSNGVKNLTILYNRLTVNYRNMNLLLLSGTPAPDTIDQHYNMIKLLKPEEMQSYTFDSFKELFSLEGYSGYIPNDTASALYSNCISFFKTSQADVARTVEKAEVIEIDPTENPLGRLILEAIGSEDTINRMPTSALIQSLVRSGTPRMKAVTEAKFLKSRSARRSRSCGLSNIVYPDQLSPDAKGRVDHIGCFRDEKIMEQYKGNVEGLLERYSPKLQRLVQNLSNPLICPGKQIIYCPFKISHGVNLIGRILTAMGISNVVYSGDVSQTKREAVLRDYNDVSNDRGDKTKVFIFTDAAAEGITLLSVRGTHLVNEDIYASHMRQVIGRAVRYRSHERLDEEEREVTIFRYKLFVGSLSPDGLNHDRSLLREMALRYLDHWIKENATI